MSNCMYAVFGVTRGLARENVVKRMRKNEQFPEMCPKEKLEGAVDIEFQLVRPKQLSCLYSNEAEAQRYAELAKKDGARDITIRRRVFVREDETTHKPVLAWA